MDLGERILEIWEESEFPPPTVLLVQHEDNLLAVVDDSDTFFRFIGRNGQVYLALNRNCSRITINDGEAYSCKRIDPVLCSPSTGPDGPRDNFVLDQIIPLIF